MPFTDELIKLDKLWKEFHWDQTNSEFNIVAWDAIHLSILNLENHYKEIANNNAKIVVENNLFANTDNADKDAAAWMEVVIKFYARYIISKGSWSLFASQKKQGDSKKIAARIECIKTLVDCYCPKEKSLILTSLRSLSNQFKTTLNLAEASEKVGKYAEIDAEAERIAKVSFNAVNQLHNNTVLESPRADDSASEFSSNAQDFLSVSSGSEYYDPLLSSDDELEKEIKELKEDREKEKNEQDEDELKEKISGNEKKDDNLKANNNAFFAQKNKNHGIQQEDKKVVNASNSDMEKQYVCLNPADVWGGSIEDYSKKKNINTYSAVWDYIKDCIEKKNININSVGEMEDGYNATFKYWEESSKKVEREQRAWIENFSSQIIKIEDFWKNFDWFTVHVNILELKEYYDEITNVKIQVIVESSEFSISPKKTVAEWMSRIIANYISVLGDRGESIALSDKMEDGFNETLKKRIEEIKQLVDYLNDEDIGDILKKSSKKAVLKDLASFGKKIGINAKANEDMYILDKVKDTVQKLPDTFNIIFEANTVTRIVKNGLTSLFWWNPEQEKAKSGKLTESVIQADADADEIEKDFYLLDEQKDASQVVNEDLLLEKNELKR